jgi:hypothetical protein
MVRRAGCSAIVSILAVVGGLGLAAPAGATTTTQLLLSQGAAFAILGHSCGGIQEHAYATGFGAHGYPQGDVYLSTSCGGSGRGGGYKVTKYTAWAAVTWDWFGNTRSYSRAEGAVEVSTSFSETDSYGDRVYNTTTAAYLETTSPPLVAPAAPTEVTASQYNIEVGESLELRFLVGWTPASETAPLITSSTVTATPVGSGAPVLTATVEGGRTSAIVGPLAPNTTYRITVTNTDAEGTSEASAPIEATSPNEDGEIGGGKEPAEEGPEFGRCVKVGANGRFTTSTCTTESPTETGGYEWVSGVERQGFTSVMKPATAIKLEAANKEKVTCTGESGSGQVTGAKTVGFVLLRLTGCESLGGKCTTEGLAEGELQTSELEGALGIISTSEKEGKEIFHVGLSLHPADEGPVVEYSCTTSGAATISGAVIAAVMSGHMKKTTAVKYAGSAGKQKPEAFENGLPEVLTNQLSERVALTLTETQTNEEPVEINPLF